MCHLSWRVSELSGLPEVFGPLGFKGLGLRVLGFGAFRLAASGLRAEDSSA